MTLAGKDLLKHTAIPEGPWVGEALEVSAPTCLYRGGGADDGQGFDESSSASTRGYVS
jgi:hypothetical protein